MVIKRPPNRPCRHGLRYNIILIYTRSPVQTSENSNSTLLCIFGNGQSNPLQFYCSSCLAGPKTKHFRLCYDDDADELWTRQIMVPESWYGQEWIFVVVNQFRDWTMAAFAFLQCTHNSSKNPTTTAAPHSCWTVGLWIWMVVKP